MKPCSICKLTLNLSAFGRDRHKRDGLTVHCKPCSKLVRNGYRAPPTPRITERVCTICSTLKPMDDYYTHSTKCKKCQLAHIASKRVSTAKPLSTNGRSVYVRLRRQSNSLFKLRSNIGTLIANCLTNSGYTKESNTASILGCSFDQFYDHIEQQFTIGMSWTNRNLWHIDHIIPVAFAQTQQELIQLNHYTNLRPIWAVDNLAKGASIIDSAVDHPIYKTIVENRISG
jgi:hypothetical protein